VYNKAIGLVEGDIPMQSVKLQAHVGNDGVLKIEVPIGLANVDLELVVVYQPVKSGWAEGYFERTYGSFADEPLERAPQGEYEEREELL
jgi:hypothetical protein